MRGGGGIIIYVRGDFKMKKVFVSILLIFFVVLGLSSCSNDPMNLNVTADREKSFVKNNYYSSSDNISIHTSDTYYVYVTVEGFGRNGMFGTTQISVPDQLFSVNGNESYSVNFKGEDQKTNISFSLDTSGEKRSSCISGYISITVYDLIGYKEAYGSGNLPDNYNSSYRYLRWNPLSVGEYNYVSIFEDGLDLFSFFEKNSTSK